MSGGLWGWLDALSNRPEFTFIINDLHQGYYDTSDYIGVPTRFPACFTGGIA